MVREIQRLGRKAVVHAIGRSRFYAAGRRRSDLPCFDLTMNGRRRAQGWLGPRPL
jgi:hypothetical protein